MFMELTQKELEVAKKRLREDIKQTKNNTHKRYFDLDASKLLYAYNFLFRGSYQ